ncbi:MAG TPA: iron-sulfur cluster assembly scaffold protein [Bryobacteraceae bacterium]|nr:iron-sulfur cluster assembly scaffold protein [Bryobacteraceae bacterium]
MFSERLLEHFQNPRNVGELPEPAVVIEVENPACGDVLRLSALIENGRVVQARYKVRGCTASIGCGSALTEMLRGIAVEELPAVDASRVAFAVGGLAAESQHAAVLCADAADALHARVQTIASRR